MSALLKGHGSKEFLLAHDTNDSQNFSNQRILVSASSSLSHDLSELATFLGQQLHEISITGSLTATFRMYLWQRCHEPAVAGVSGVLYWRFSTGDTSQHLLWMSMIRSHILNITAHFEESLMYECVHNTHISYIDIYCVFVNMLYQQSRVNPCEPEKSEHQRISDFGCRKHHWDISSPGQHCVLGASTQSALLWRKPQLEPQCKGNERCFHLTSLDNFKWSAASF